MSHLLLLCDEKNITGTYNISGRERISKLLFAQWVAEVFGFDSNLVIPISIDDLNLRAPRPKNLGMDCSKISSKLGINLPELKEDLKFNIVPLKDYQDIRINENNPLLIEFNSL